MKNRVIFSLLFLVFQSTSFASAFVKTDQASCSNIDFRDSFSMKIRDQNSISWCYAFDAADYLQYTYRLPSPISAADIAIAYTETGVSDVMTFFKRIFSKEDRLEPPQTGFIDMAIKTILPQGYCPEEILPSEKWTQISTQDQSQTQVGLLQAIMNLYDLQKKVKNKQIVSADQLPWYFDLKNLTQTRLFTLLRDSSQNKLLPAIRETVCQNDRAPFPVYPIKRTFAFRSGKIFEKINSNFNSGMPSSIDFYSGIFDDYTNYKKRVSDLHTVLLYGRKFDPVANECVYLMKDSHGTDCSQYDTRIECEAGYLWFPESKIFDVITSDLIIERL